ncbi:uncharacterized protein METZ01_LOCUS336564, partial [marine metagenome]
ARRAALRRDILDAPGVRGRPPPRGRLRRPARPPPLTGPRPTDADGLRGRGHEPLRRHLPERRPHRPDPVHLGPSTPRPRTRPAGPRHRVGRPGGHRPPHRGIGHGLLRRSHRRSATFDQRRSADRNPADRPVPRRLPCRRTQLGVRRPRPLPGNQRIPARPGPRLAGRGL